MKKTKTHIEHGPNAFDQALFSWTAPETIQHQKGWLWFLLAGIFVVLFGIYSFLTENWTLIIAIVIVSAIYVWQHFEIPQNKKIIISKVGIKIGSKEYPYQNIKAFWIIYNPPYITTLNLGTNSAILPNVSIQLLDIDPAPIREYLCSQIVEIEGKKENFTDYIIRIFKI